MEKSEVPPYWADFVERSREHVTDEHFELVSKMWLFPTHELGDISMPDCTNNDPNLGTSSKTNPSISTVSTRIEPSPSNLGLSSLLDASRFQKIMSQALSHIQSLHFAKTKTVKVISSPHNVKILCWYLVSLIWRWQVYSNHHKLPQSTELITTVQQLRHTLHLLCNSTHNRLYNQSQSFYSFLSSTQLVLFRHLPLRILIQLMSIFHLWPKYQMIWNKLMAFF
jgi:hypothetical protein